MTAMTTTTAIAKTEPQQPGRLMRPIVKPAEMIAAHKEAADVIREALERGRDYGVIPGTRGTPTLLKPGAERLCVAFGLVPEYQILTQETDHDRVNHFVDRNRKPQTSLGLYRYVVKCILKRDGIVVGEGIGSCSTMEQKFISRPRDCENTALKIAKKRAKVDAVLDTLSLSDRFTQDVGDDEHDNQQPDDADDVVVEPPTVNVNVEKQRLATEITGMFDELGTPTEQRGEEVARLLGKPRPGSLDDLTVVRDKLRDLVLDKMAGGKAKQGALIPDDSDKR